MQALPGLVDCCSACLCRLEPGSGADVVRIAQQWRGQWAIETVYCLACAQQRHLLTAPDTDATTTRGVEPERVTQATLPFFEGEV